METEAWRKVLQQTLENRQCVIVVKSIPQHCDDSTLENYLEIVADNQVAENGIQHYPGLSAELKSVALVAFEDKVHGDIRKLKSRIREKPVSKQTKQCVEIEVLDPPRGIVVRNIPPPPNKDLLELFFEKHENVGYDVQRIKVHDGISTAVLEFQEDLESVLPTLLKKVCILKGKSLEIEPYFPEFHDQVISVLNNAESQRATTDEAVASTSCDEPAAIFAVINPPTPNMDVRSFEARKPVSSASSKPVISNLQVFDSDDDWSASESEESSKDPDEVCQNEEWMSIDQSVVTPNNQYTNRENRRRYSRRKRNRSQSTVNIPEDAVEKTLKYRIEEIMILIFASLRRECVNCQVNISSKFCSVKLKGSTEALQNAEREIRNILDNRMKECVSEVSVSTANVFSISKGKASAFVKCKLKKEKKKAYIGVRGETTMFSIALSDEEAKTSLEFILSLVKTRIISYSNILVVNSQPMKYLFKKLRSSKLISISIEENKNHIVVVGVEPDWSTTCKEIQQELAQESLANIKQSNDARVETEKSLQVNTSYLMETPASDAPLQYKCYRINKGKSRCYKRNPSLISKMMNIQSHFLKDSGAGSSFELKKDDGEIVIEVRGRQPVYSQQIQQILDSMWEGKLDLYRISKDDQDVGIISCALFEQKEFVKMFECQHQCGIIMTRGKKSVKLPPSQSTVKFKKLEVEDNDDVLSDLPTKSKAERSSTHAAREPKENYQVNRYEDYRLPRTKSADDVMAARRVSGDDENVATQRKSLYDLPEGENLMLSPRRSSVDDMFGGSPYPYDESLGLQNRKPVQTYTVKNCTLQVEQGDISKYKADCLVNFFDAASGIQSKGLVFNHFMKVGGDKLMQYLTNQLSGMDNSQCYFTEASEDLKSSYVCHLSLPPYNNGLGMQKLKELIGSCFDWCESVSDVKTIAFPAVGVGRLLGFPVKEVAKCLISESINRANKDARLKFQISFLLWDEGNLSAFRHELQQVNMSAGFLQPNRPAFPPFLPVQPSHPTIKHYVPSLPTSSRNQPQPPRMPNRFGLKHQFPRQHDQPVEKKEQHHSSCGKHIQERRSDARKEKFSSNPKRGFDGSKTVTLSNEGKTVPVIEVSVYAECKEKGEQLRSKLSQRIKEMFLYTDHINNPGIASLRKDNREKIYQIGKNRNVFITVDKVKSNIELKGGKDEVMKTYKEICDLEHLKVDSADQGEKSKENKHLRGSKKYWEFCINEPPVPKYWKYFKDGKTYFQLAKEFILSKKAEHYDVDSKTFSAIKKLVEKTWQSQHVGVGADARNLNHKGIHVKKIEIIENVDLFKMYSDRRRKIMANVHKIVSLEKIKDRGGQTIASKGPVFTEKHTGSRLTSNIFHELNEFYFFHGTKDEYVKNIMNKGVDPNYGDDKGLFGRGIYCAESSTKADQYTDAKDQRHKKDRKMFLMRLLLGNIFVSTQDHKYKKPPCSSCLNEACANHHHEPFDSVVGDGKWLFREFVVYHKDQCYPEYLITYDRI